MPTLKEQLQHWQDPDVAIGRLAVLCGIYPEGDMMGRAKSVLWSNNPLGNALCEVVYKLVDHGILQEDDEGRIRWNPDWKGYWET